MKRLFIAVIFIFVAQNAVAHSGHKKESPPAPIVESSTTDPMYATEEKEPDPFKDSDLFLPSDLFMQGEVVTDKPDEGGAAGPAMPDMGGMGGMGGMM